MQTLWVILVKAGLLNARLLQVIPAAFVPSVHAHPIREVQLDVAGFPEIRAMRDEVVRLRARHRGRDGQLLGESRAMQELRQRIERVAPTELPVLIQGETGSGKELVARAVHQCSHRTSGPLISENCGAFSESLLASELFGHEKGAFTGAAHGKRGMFELAHAGTLFLDEVGDLSLPTQVSLLRVIQEGHLRRLGSERAIQVNVRIVAATHRDLEGMVAAGSFREDLYYRLAGATLHVPPLRNRTDDLQDLISHFLKELGSTLRLTKEALRALIAYRWPGNVRQLRSEVARWHAFCDKVARYDHLDPQIATGESVAAASISKAAPQPSIRHLQEVVAEAELRAIENALAISQGNLVHTARALGIDRNTLKRKLRHYMLSPNDYRSRST